MLAGCTPWPADLAARYRREGYWRGQTLGDLVDEWAERYGDREAIIAGDARISYRELRRQVNGQAHSLFALGLRPGERLVMQLPNVPEFIYLYFACAKIGVLPVMALPAHRFAEISYLVQFSEAAAYSIAARFRGFDYTRLAEQVRASSACLRDVITVTDDVPPDAVEWRCPDHVAEDSARFLPFRPDSADVALFLLSGGTTGLPKLIPRTHDDYAYCSRAAAEVCGFGPDTVYLASLPIAHNFPLASPGIQGAFQVGGKVVLLSSPDPAEAFPLIQRERVTATALVPALALRWMDAPDRERYDLSSLRLLQVGGARLNPEAARRVRPTLGCQLQQVFGMAEGLVNYTRLDDSDEVVEQTQGRPVSTADEIRIVDEDGRDVPAGETGELLTRGPYTIRGYYNVPEHNARAFTPDGFYRTGDVVRLHPSGNLSVEGREKDLINRGGEKISAEEIEDLILAHPAAFNAAVVAMPDAVLGERACAYVILRPGASLTFDELIAFLDGKQIARFKLPERLEIVESFPLTSVGKVSKKDLREDIVTKLRREGKV
jgi:2,3-dihydroxybenzoate-AMP ligase